MKKEFGQPILPKGFFKQFKDREQFHNFFHSLFKHGAEAMLEGVILGMYSRGMTTTGILIVFGGCCHL